MAILCLLGLVACAPTATRMHDFSQGKPVMAPDSLKAKATFTAIAYNGDQEKLSAVIFAAPAQRYRLELTGSLGVGAASLLWQKSGWTLLFPTEDQYLQGTGAEIRIPGTVLSGIDVHGLAGIFWGELLPAGFENSVPKVQGDLRVMEWEPRIGLLYRAVLRSDGWVVSVERREDGRAPLLVRYGEPQELAGLVVPVSATFSRAGKDFLAVTIKSVDTQATWAAGVWRLPVPKSYQLWAGGDRAD